MTALAPTLEAFFAQRLIAQRRVSPNTVAAYRDTFRLLLAFLHKHTGISPSRLALTDLDGPAIGAFLDHLEHDRGVAISTRNARLAAIHSFFSFAALRHPEHAALIQRVLAIPAKRTSRAPLSYLTTAEADALTAAPDTTTRLGRRDRALLLTAVQTGLRVSELTGLRRQDLEIGSGPTISCTGKGRKHRRTPLSAPATAVLRAWITETTGSPGDPLFPGPGGRPLTRDAVRRIVERHARAAAIACPSLAAKNISPHTLRHTAAMALLAAGVDTAVIALWMGHESVRTTDIYLHADLSLKQKALERITPAEVTPGRYQPRDALLAFLEAL